jgi:hypothetical protein
MKRVSAGAAAFLLTVSLLASAQAEPPVEPTIQQVLRLALKAARSLGPERTRELCRRARLAGLVPTLKVAARRGLEQDLSASSTADSDRTNASQGDDLTLEASLSFDLSRLVFASEEVRVLSIERWLLADRRRLIEEVTRLYFQRQRLLNEQATAAAPDPELAVAIAEIEALLDAFTDGAYAKALARARRR